MGFLGKLFARSGPKRKAGKATQQTVEEQRRQLEKRLMTPERQELIAQAMTVRRTKQALLKDLEANGGAERIADALRRMMEERR